LAEKRWVIDTRYLADTRLGNFICNLRGPAREEAIDLLIDLQMTAIQASFGLTARNMQQLLNAKPIHGRKGVFEKKGKHLRVYFKYEPGRKLVVLDGGLKTTQKRDTKRLRRKAGS
jgi:putative component of toxin-antitoxin plasmid stabilization module